MDLSLGQIHDVATKPIYHSSGWCDTRKFYPLYILHVIFSYFRQSACIMSFIIFNYVRQDRILGVADHKFLKSLDTVHTNAAPLRCSPFDCSKEAHTAREEVEPRFSYAVERVFAAFSYLRKTYQFEIIGFIIFAAKTE